MDLSEDTPALAHVRLPRSDTRVVTMTMRWLHDLHVALDSERIHALRSGPWFILSEHHCASVHDDVRAVDVPPRIAHQGDERPRQFKWVAHPTHRISRIPAVPCVLQPLSVVEYGVHVTRAQAVDANAVAAPLGRQTLRQRQ
jgi:hypothetical protein